MYLGSLGRALHNPAATPVDHGTNTQHRGAARGQAPRPQAKRGAPSSCRRTRMVSPPDFRSGGRPSLPLSSSPNILPDPTPKPYRIIPRHAARSKPPLTLVTLPKPSILLATLLLATWYLLFPRRLGQLTPRRGSAILALITNAVDNGTTK